MYNNIDDIDLLTTFVYFPFCLILAFNRYFFKIFKYLDFFHKPYILFNRQLSFDQNSARIILGNCQNIRHQHLEKTHILIQFCAYYEINYSFLLPHRRLCPP